MRYIFSSMRLWLCVLASLWLVSDVMAQQVYDIRDFGAVGDGQTLDTHAIQQAIDKCSQDGGGQVLIPNGVFLSKTIVLKSNVALYLNATAVLTGVADLDAYTHLAFIYAEGQENIAILGRGKIHGQGEHAVFQGDDNFNGIRHGRPNTVHLLRCTNVRLDGLTVENGARWNIKLQESVNVSVNDIRVISRAVANNDGLDIVDCHDVRVANSYFDCGDDGICPKSDSKMGVRNLVITNCIVKSESNAIKFGTASVGGFENVAISNCVIFDTRLSGIALELVDGGVMERITISNITMHRVNGGIFIKLGNRKGNTPGILRHVKIDNIIADGVGEWLPDTTADYYKSAHDRRIGMTITGQPDYPVENVTLSNIYMQFAGGGTTKDAGIVMTDRPKSYPEYTNYGITPAYGFNCRHVENLTFDHVVLDYVDEDKRPAVFFEAVNGLTLSDFRAKVSDEAMSAIRIKDAQDIYIHSCRPAKSEAPFIRFEGNVLDATVMNNDFSRVSEGVQFSNGFADTGIRSLNNLTK